MKESRRHASQKDCFLFCMAKKGDRNKTLLFARRIFFVSGPFSHGPPTLASSNDPVSDIVGRKKKKVGE